MKKIATALVVALLVGAATFGILKATHQFTKAADNVGNYYHRTVYGDWNEATVTFYTVKDDGSLEMAYVCRKYGACTALFFVPRNEVKNSYDVVLVPERELDPSLKESVFGNEEVIIAGPNPRLVVNNSRVDAELQKRLQIITTTYDSYHRRDWIAALAAMGAVVSLFLLVWNRKKYLIPAEAN